MNVIKIQRSEHITPALISLHWLRVPERISFKLAVLTYRSTHSTSPSYVQSCFTRVVDMTLRRRLRSSASHRLEVPLLWHSRVGKWGFPVAGANTWNDLLFHITSVQSLAVFRQRLKTFLFSHSYPDILMWLTYHYWLLSLFFFFSGISHRPCNNWHYAMLNMLLMMMMFLFVLRVWFWFAQVFLEQGHETSLLFPWSDIVENGDYCGIRAIELVYCFCDQVQWRLSWNKGCKVSLLFLWAGTVDRRLSTVWWCMKTLRWWWRVMCQQMFYSQRVTNWKHWNARWLLSVFLHMNDVSSQQTDVVMAPRYTSAL